MAAVTGLRTIVMKNTQRSACILHREVMALIAGSLLSRDGTHTLLSDHQNSVRLLDDPTVIRGDETRFRRANGRSYYRWLMHIRQRGQAPSVVYTRAHQNDDSDATRLNTLADYYATQSQRYEADVPEAPIPTFSMDPFTFFTLSDGWIEGNIREFYAHFHAVGVAERLAAKPRMATWLYTHAPPPEYPYLKAFNAYSAIVQWYARSGQLPTATAMIRRKSSDVESPCCRMQCDSALEDEYHVFVECPQFGHMREEAASALRARLERTIRATEVEEQRLQDLLDAAECFYSTEHGLWPLKMSQYFYGQVPEMRRLVPSNLFKSPLDRQRFVHKIVTDWHLSSIRLAGRIWGDFARRTAKVFLNDKSA